MTLTPKQRRQLEGFREANLEAARIVAADPTKYPGLMQQWAALVLNPTAERTKPEIGRAA